MRAEVNVRMRHLAPARSGMSQIRLCGDPEPSRIRNVPATNAAH
jgi:hypothetical protein